MIDRLEDVSQHRIGRPFRGVRRSVWIVVALTCWLLSDAGFADPPRYQPAVGESYDYGIECVVRSRQGSMQPIRYRCRLQFKVTEVGADGWSAEYSTTPVTASGLVSMSAAEPISPPPMPSIHGASGFHAAMSARFAALQARAAKTRASLAGLMTRVEGTVRVRPNGESVHHTGETNMPLLFGSVWAVPLIRLPDYDEQTSYAYKDVMGLQLSRDGVVQQSEAYLINSFTHDSNSRDGVYRATRQVELAGGATANESLRASGDGFAEFSLADSMPESGVVDMNSEGLAYDGSFGNYSMRVAFQRLNDWQGELFDLYMQPTAAALEVENSPRLTGAAMRELVELVKSANRPPQAELLVSRLAEFAPPPPDSQLFKTFDSKLAEIVNPAVTTVKSRDEWFYNEMSRAFQRWQRIYGVATQVPRQWSDATGGFKVQAKLVSRTATDVKLQRVDNDKTIAVPIERLSSRDQEIVKNFAKLEGTSSP